MHAHFLEKKRVQLSELELEEDAHPWYVNWQPLAVGGKENSSKTR